MAKQRRYTFRGSDAARARALSKKTRRPTFRFGDVVIDAWGDIAAIEAIFANLQSVEDAGILDDAAAWKRGLSKKPKTPNSGLWYVLAYGHGQGVAGEDDLRRAPDGAASKPE